MERLTTPINDIPVIDIQEFEKEGGVSEEIINSVGKAFHNIGFVFLRVPEILTFLPPIYKQFSRVFALSDEIKQKYAHSEIHFQRGWTPKYAETGTECRKIGKNNSDIPDAKEAWFMGPDLSKQHPLVQQYPDAYPDNIWPTEIPEFRMANELLHTKLYSYGLKLLHVIGQYLNKPSNYFDEMVKDSPTVLRAIHYLPVLPEQVNNTVWACKHTDINLITMLPASTYEGLWIKRRNGMWIPGIAPAGCVIAQVGDMLQYATGGHFISAWHTVRAPKTPTKKGRISAALFIHARSDYLFEPVTDNSLTETFPPITAYDILKNRLREIGLHANDS